MAVRSRSLIPLLCACAFCISTGCSRSADSGSGAAQSSADGSKDLTAEATAWADSVMRDMTVEQMAGQLVMPATYASADPVTLRLLRSYVMDSKVGGVAFHKGDTLSMRILSDSISRMSGIPLFLAIDAENGLGMRLKDATAYPLNCELTDATEQSMYDYGAAVGAECEAVGINMVFGPVLDVVPGPGWYMYKRSLGSEPQRVADLGMAYARGLEDAGIMPVAKHFPGYGHTRTDPHVWLPVIDRTAEEFSKTDLLPFRRYVDYGFPALMAAHVAVPALTGDSLPADFSEKLIAGLLREQMRFPGLVISDAVNMGAVKSIGSSESPAVLALLAGVDIILAPSDTRRAIGDIVDAVKSGLLSADLLREHVHRVLFYKYLSFL